MHWLDEPAKAGVFQLSGDARELAGAAAASGFMVIYVDIGHAHDKEDFLDEASRAMRFPERFNADWDTFAKGLKDLSWLQAKGWVVILEKSKHFCGGPRHALKQAVEAQTAQADPQRA